MALNCCKKGRSSSNNQSIALKKEVGILQGMSIVVGIIVGSGIFVSPVGVLKNTNSVGFSFIMWVIAGVFSAVGALVYAELGVTLPKSGGEYIYILETFGSFAAFIALWVTLFVIGTVGCAVNSLVLAEYLLKPFYPTCAIPNSTLHMIAIMGLLLLCFINCYSVKWATKLSIAFTAGKVCALLLIVGFGSYYLALGNVQSFQHPFEHSATSLSAIAKAFYQGFWAYAGWNYLNFLTSEVKNPGRNLPIIVVLSITVVTVIYLLVNVAYLAVLSPFEVLSTGDSSTAVAVAFAARCMGVMQWIMPIFVGASVFGSINGEVLSLSRLFFSASEQGHMPSILSMISVTNMTPIPAVLALILIAILFQFHDNVFLLIELTGIAFSLVSAIAVCSLLHLRRTRPLLNKGGLKLPIFIHVIFLLVDIALGVFAIYDAPNDALLFIGLVAISIPIYVFGVAWKKKPQAINVFMYRMTIFLQKLFNVVHPENTEEELDKTDPNSNLNADTEIQLSDIAL